MPSPVLAFTPGDPAGIGPEILAAALADPSVRTSCQPIVVAPRALLEAGARQMRIRPRALDGLLVVEPDGVSGLPVRAGRPDASSARIAYACIRKAIELARTGRASGIVTGPVSKHALAEAGLRWTDHTSILADAFGIRPLQMLIAGSLRVLHATDHLSVRDAAAAVDEALVWRGVHILAGLLKRLGFARPRIAVAGVNPHAGEGGLIGSEEAAIVRIIPLVRGLRVAGPIAPDVVFRRAARGEFDGVLCFLHDHGHIAVKTSAGPSAVQVSAGLSIVRTSPAHGTAEDLAGKGRADPSGAVAAALAAARLASGKGAAIEIPPLPRLRS